MTPLRVLHLTRDYPPKHSGGLSTAVAGMVRAQCQAGMECTVVSFDNFRPSAGHQRDEGAAMDESIHGTPGIRVHEKVALESALELVATLRSSVVHVHHESLWDFGQQAACALGAGTVFSAHTLQSEQDRLRASAPTRSSEAQAHALVSADLIHAPSSTVAELLCASVPTLRQKVRSIPLASESWPRAQDDSKRDSGAPMLLYVGRFADINGFAQFLAALPPLFEKVPELTAVAAGGLPGNERGATRWKKRWRKMAGPQEARLQMPGWLERDALSALYRRATLLVVPSWFETFGQVILEGMLHGTPILTTGAGAIAELVDEESARLMEARCSHAIAQGVLETLEHPQEAAMRAQVARLRASEGYLWSSRMPAFLELYGELV